MPKNAGQFFQLVAFAIVPFVFIWVFGQAIYLTFKAANAPPVFTTPFVLIAGGSAGAVGGAVALSLGVKSTNNNQNLLSSSRELGKQYGKLTLPNTPEKWQEVIGWIYLIAYFLLGGLATFVWVSRSGESVNVVPELVEALAASFWGLVLAVAAKRTT